MALHMKTPPGAVASGTSVGKFSQKDSTHGRLRKALSWRLWSLEYSAEEARQRYADRGYHRRAFCMRLVLALLRIAGGRT